MSLNKASNIILSKCMGLKNSESCLVVSDFLLKDIGFSLFRNSLNMTKKSKIVFIPIPKAHGCEPPKDTAKQMLKHDVSLLATTKSLSHTKARKNASKNGARIASMPGITKDMMERALNVDFNKIRKLNQKLISILKNKKSVKITTKKGTDIKFFVKTRKWTGDDGIYTNKGSFGNLPAGEVFIAPLEYKTNGIIIADASVGGLGMADKQIKIQVKDGFIKRIEGGKIAKNFEGLLKNKLYRNVAELGIGTNPRAMIKGEVLEDEKVFGTCHIAFGNNKHFGGNIDVPFHIDFVVRKPTIYADNVLIMKEGKMNKNQNLLY